MWLKWIDKDKEHNRVENLWRMLISNILGKTAKYWVHGFMWSIFCLRALSTPKVAWGHRISMADGVLLWFNFAKYFTSFGGKIYPYYY